MQLSTRAGALHNLTARLMRFEPVIVQHRYHCLEDVLAGIQLGLLLVATDSEPDLSCAEKDARFESSHFIATKFFRNVSWLALKLHLCDLGQ